MTLLISRTEFQAASTSAANATALRPSGSTRETNPAAASALLLDLALPEAQLAGGTRDPDAASIGHVLQALRAWAGPGTPQRFQSGALDNDAHPDRFKDRGAVDPQTEALRRETIAILGRHEDRFMEAVDEEGVKKMIADEKTPPDLTRALKNVLADPEMADALDGARWGDNDDRWGVDDINALQGNRANKQYSVQKAESYQPTYVPSDAARGRCRVRSRPTTPSASSTAIQRISATRWT